MSQDQPGGPFVPSTITYTLQNTGNTTISWSAAATQNWITLSASSGNLGQAAKTTATVSFNANTMNLGAGSYSDTVTFTNLTNGTGNASCPVNLTITQQTNPVPTTTSLSPSSKTAGAAAFTLTVNGTGFVAGSTVLWNGATRTTTYSSSTKLTAAITAADIAAAGTVSVTVFSPTPGGGTSNAQTFTISGTNNPVPTTTSLSPSSKTAGAAAFTLTVNGTGFVAGSTVLWNGATRTTTYSSSTKLTAAITAADIAAAGTVSVTVFSPTPGGGTSNAQTFTISGTNNPVPTTTSLSPSSKTAGAAAFTLTVNGTGFVAGSTVLWNGATRTTTYSSSTKLTAAITAADIAAAGTVSVTVFSPTPGGGTSNAQTFTISGTNNPVPTTTSLSPSSKTAGAAAFTLTVNGTGFVAGSTVLWNGATRTTTYSSSTKLTAAITAADIAAAGTVSVTVFSPTPGGGTSNAQTFTISGTNNPVPTTTSLSPSSKTAGAAAFTLTVNGTGFVAGSTVLWNGATRTTTYSSSTKLTAAITAADIAAAGTVSVTVFSPTPGGGTSNAQTFTISGTNNPVPTTTSLSPSSKTAGAAAFTLTVNGTGFVAGSTVLWNGATRTTTYSSSTKLTAAITAADIAAAGTVSVTVFSPTPGGGTSNAQTFTISSGSAGGLAPDITTSTDAGPLTGSTITTPTFTTKVGNELLLAFIATASTGATPNTSVTGVSGGGLTWTLVRRSNTQQGTAEIWSSFAAGTLTNATATASLSQSGIAALITLVTFSGVNTTTPVGATGGGSAATGAPTASLTTQGANSLVFGVGNDWDGSGAHTVGSNQTMVHQYLSTVTGDTFWVQRQNATTQPAGTAVTINNTAPTNHQWNLSIVEIRQ